MDQLNSLYKEWQALQPIKPEAAKRLEDKFKLEFNYNSNHLEGNTLTYGQTQLLFMFGQTTGDAPLKDYEEMKAHDVGLRLVQQEAADKERPLSEQFIRNLNQTILVQNYWKDAITPAGAATRMEVKIGEYKTRPNSVITVTGELFEYASPEETRAFMTDLVKWYNEAEQTTQFHPVELAALLHYRYIRIHPFEDGNGRIARLLVNYVLARHGYPMIIIQSADKQNYLGTLRKCDIASGLDPYDGAHATAEQITPFTNYLKTQLERALVLSIKAAKGENIEEEDDFAKRIAVLEKQAKNPDYNPLAHEEQVWKLLEHFLIPLHTRITEGLRPIEAFFEEVWRVIRLYKSFPSIGEIVTPDNFHKNNQVLIKQIRNAEKAVATFQYKIPKKEYRLDHLKLEFEVTVQLKGDHYFFNNKKFHYGSYPSAEAQEQLIVGFKQAALQKIESALKQ